MNKQEIQDHIKQLQGELDKLNQKGLIIGAGIVQGQIEIYRKELNK